MKRLFFYDMEFIEAPGKIDVISIGIVNEEGRELYLCNLDADLSCANDWVQRNVIPKLPIIPNDIWVKKDVLAERILAFLAPSKKDPVELWGNFAAYDHVALCWLFGDMESLPEGMPMITFDIQQEKGNIAIPPPLDDYEHNALYDAQWNRHAYFWIKNRRALG